MEKKSKNFIKMRGVIRKTKILLSIWVVLGINVPVFSEVALAETETTTTNTSSREATQSNVVENELSENSQSTPIKESDERKTTEESNALVPENSEPEKNIKRAAKNTRGTTDAAVSKITVSNTGIVLKNDGSYLLMDTPKDYVDGTYDPDTHVKEEGQYDENTIVEFSNSGSTTINELYSERKPSGVNQIQQIIIADGTFSELTILSDSALAVHNNLDYGIKVSKLIIGEREELDWKPVKLDVSSNKIGIYTVDGTENITGDVHTSANQAGISVTKENPPAREDYSAMSAFREKLEQENAYGEYIGEIGTKMHAEASGSSGSGAVFTRYTLDGAELTGKSNSEGYGVFSTEGAAVETKYGSAGEATDRFYEAYLTGEASTGIGIFIEGILLNYGGKIDGTSVSGNGVEANYYEAYPDSHSGEDFLSDLKGTTNTGFGIIMRNFYDNGGVHEITAGSIQLTSGTINGQSTDGTGIFAGGIRVEPEQEVGVTGSAIKGQGIVAEEMLTNKYDSPKPKISILGESTGESNTTMATIEQLFSDNNISSGELPTSAGAILLRGLDHSGVDLSLKATAPIEIDASYGIYSNDEMESRIGIVGDKNVSVEAKGDHGIKAAQLDIRLEEALSDTAGVITVDVDARSAGIQTKRDISITGYSETEHDTGSKINIVASEGKGIVAQQGLRLSFTGDSNLYQIPVTISARDIAIEADNTSGDEGASTQIEFSGINATIINAAIGIKGMDQNNYNFSDSYLSIKTSDKGIELKESDESGYMTLYRTSMEIESGTYGFRTDNISLNIEGGGSQRKGHLSDSIDVIAQKYPIWFAGISSEGQPILTIYNNKNYDEEWNEQPNELSIKATSKTLQPDKGSYPAFYVENHQIDTDGSLEDIKIIENYETKVSDPFNATPTTPYSTAADFNIEKYANYEWTAVRTDTNNDIVIDTSQIAQNKLFTSDTDYTEAKLTARRLNHKSAERIFTDESSVVNPDMILHEINMLVRREQQYTVTYDPNGADGGTTPNDPTLYSQGDIVNVAPQGDLVKSDHKFVGWLNSVDNQIYQNPFLSSSPTTYTMAQADVIFTAQWQPDSIVEELELLTAKIPDQLKFGTHKIENSADKTYYATDSGSDNENAAATDMTTGAVGVKDTRLSTVGWSLTVKQLTQFKTASNQELTGAQLSFHAGQPDLSQSTGGAPGGVSDQRVTLTPNVSSQLLLASNGQGKGIVELPLEKFKLEIPSTAEKYASDYTTQIEWLVSNIP
ncbi:WxL domain-containing protein [Enterococcus sp. AZ196]|uniref:WxL domain-containing protein n=1 Tax=Enterococcus sp. AZ196 TaxID=2774659 RepID=UPI003D2BD28A